MRAGDARNGSEESATAFTVSHYSNKALVMNPRERGCHIQPVEAVTFHRIATVEPLQLEYIHTQSALPYSSCGYA